jgi:hypothetical protein
MDIEVESKKISQGLCYSHVRLVSEFHASSLIQNVSGTGSAPEMPCYIANARQWTRSYKLSLLRKIACV